MEQTRRHALYILQHGKQNMLRANLAAIKKTGKLRAVLQNGFCAGCQPLRFFSGRTSLWGDQPVYQRNQLLRVHLVLAQDNPRRTIRLLYQSDQQMLRTDITVPAALRGLFRQAKRFAGAFRIITLHEASSIYFILPQAVLRKSRPPLRARRMPEYSCRCSLPASHAAVTAAPLRPTADRRSERSPRLFSGR